MFHFEVSFIQSFIIVIIYYIYSQLTSTYDYWTKMGVVGPKPVILLGNLGDYIFKRKSAAIFIRDLYNSYPEEKYIGIFKGRTPGLVVKDLDLIKLVAIKDFNHFNSRGLTITHEDFNHNIFLANGEKWRVLRHKLAPSFSSGSIRNMYYLIERCAELLESHVSQLLGRGIQSEIREIISSYTLEVQGSCMFGIEMGNLSQEDTAFKKMGKETANHKILAFYLHCMFPGILKTLGVKLRHESQTDFFLGLVQKVVKEREGKMKTRHDFMDLLIDLKENQKYDTENDLNVTDKLIMAQMFVFFIAGIETTSGAISFALHELCLNQDIQEKLHREIVHVISKYTNKLTYEALNEMTYLSMVFDETLRKYPSCAEHYRMCYKDYTIGSRLRLKKGDKVNIPVYAIHHDPKYYPDPEKFIPERFTAEEKQKRNPLTYMPFGIGPRICIGARFAKLKSLAAIAIMVKSFRLTPTEKTQQNIIFSSSTLTLQSRDGFWMQIEKR